MTDVLLAPDHLLETHCAAVALERAGLRVSLAPAQDLDAVVVFARPEDVPDHPPTSGRGGTVPLLLVCPVVDDAALRAAERIGAAAVLTWDGPTADLVEAVGCLVRGESSRPQAPEARQDPLRELTHRELQIARMIGGGATNLGIAEGLGISYHTVRTHVGHLMAKLGVTHRYAIVPLVQRSERALLLDEDGIAGAVAR
jgi:DNA-binding CsgD family transcriptional regulator